MPRCDIFNITIIPIIFFMTDIIESRIISLYCSKY